MKLNYSWMLPRIAFFALGYWWWEGWHWTIQTMPPSIRFVYPVLGFVILTAIVLDIGDFWAWCKAAFRREAASLIREQQQSTRADKERES